MRVCLIGPSREENLSIRYLSASLLGAGFETGLVGFNGPEDCAAAAEAAADADIVGLSMCFQARAREFIALAERIRQINPGTLMVAGGHFASCAAADLLRHVPAIDLAAIHEGEQTIVDIARWRASGDSPVSAIRGIAYRDGSAVRFSPPRPIIEDLDSLPTPDRRGPVHLVAGVPTAYLFGSRGCLGACDYCCISTLHALAPGRRFRQRDPHRIADEMAGLYRGRGVRQFIFHDDNFLVPSETLNHRRLEAYEQAFRDRGMAGIALYMKCRPGDATPAVLQRLRDMGLVRLFMGIESSTARGYESLGRRQAVAESERALQACTELGISAQYTLLAFHLDATLGTIRSDIRFMREHVDHPLNFGRVELHAGTPLERRMIEAGLARGDWLARSYSLVDPAADLACALWKIVFRERCTGETGLMNGAILLNYLAAVMDRFYAGAAVRKLSRDIEAWRLRATTTSIDLLERIVDWCEAAADPRDVRLPGFLRELAAEEESTARALRREGDELHRRLDDLTLGMVGLEEAGGRMSRVAGFRGSVVKHVAAVALAFQVAGTVPAFGCCDMEERVLDVDHDGLADDLELQVFATDPKATDSDADGVGDAQEDHDADGIANLVEQDRIEGLSRAAKTHDMAALKRLIAEGVELDATHPDYEQPPLAIAAGKGFTDAVQALLEAGARIDAPNRTGLTALMEAARSNKAAALGILLKAGAVIDLRDAEGHSALMLGAWYGHEEIVRILLEAGADIGAKDKGGKNALQLARESGHAAIVDMIVKARP